jgi:hypothetical protein
MARMALEWLHGIRYPSISLTIVPFLLCSFFPYLCNWAAVGIAFPIGRRLGPSSQQISVTTDCAHQTVSSMCIALLSGPG